MRRLHLSKKLYTASAGELGRWWHSWEADEVPGPACGAPDGKGVIRRGRGASLVHETAVSAEWHCPECVAIDRKERPK